jgi:hypothetical protein
MNIYKELSFAMEYDQFYQSDGGRAVDMAEKAVISDLLLQVDSREMLELGCGTGHWTAFFSEKGFRVTAVDQSPAMLEQARKRVIPEVQWVSTLPLISRACRGLMYTIGSKHRRISGVSMMSTPTREDACWMPGRRKTQGQPSPLCKRSIPTTKDGFRLISSKTVRT